MSGNPRRAPIVWSISAPPGGIQSSGVFVVSPGPNMRPQTQGTMSPQWSRCQWVIAIASSSGQGSRSRSRASTPGPQSSKMRRPSLSSRYPDWAPPGFGQAGEHPATTSFMPASSPYTLPPVARKIRVVIAKPGLDGHDRGAKIIARALRDAGMEVIYTGLHQTPEQIVETAIQEDADAVGISILSGAHMTLVPRILEGLKANGAEDVLVVVGGTIPDEDAAELTSQGVAGIFTPGAPTSEIVDFLKQKVPVP